MWNALARLLTRLTRHRELIVRGLIGLAGVSLVLGAVGWARYDKTVNGGADIDLFAIVYGTLGLFAFVGDVAVAPWPLAVARITAPLTTLGVAFAAVLTFSETRTHRRVARSSRAHLVVLGPSGRIAPYLNFVGSCGDPGAGIPPSTIVRLDSDHEPGTDHERAQTLTASVRVDLDPFRLRRDGWDTATTPEPTSWVQAAAVAEAAEAVIATGRDDWNIAALGEALQLDASGSEPAPPGPRVIVEIDDRSAALRLAVALAADPTTSGRDIEVVCRDEIVARLAVDALLASGTDTPDELAVVGDGPMIPLVAMELGRRLEASDLYSGARRSLTIIHPEIQGAERSRELMPSARVAPKTSDDIGVLLGPGAPATLAFVDYADPEERARAAIELISSHQEHRVVALLGSGPQPFPTRLHSLDDRRTLGRDQLVGPLERAAKASRTSASLMRSIVAALAANGYAVTPSAGFDEHCELDRPTKAALVAAGANGDMAEDAVLLLRSVGLIVTLPSKLDREGR